jgi:hypothetical protein
MSSHRSPSPERWSAFSLDQQVLMIGNEMSRAAKLMERTDRERQRRAYERVLELTDLTVRVQRKPNLRKELLRWRDLVGALYIEEAGRPREHADALRCLLRFTPAASKQIPLLGLDDIPL